MYEFDGVWFGRLLSGPAVVVTDVGTRQLRVFDASGKFVRTIGRRGEGPGEFRMFHGLYDFGGDSIAVYDLAMLRASVFGRDGAFVRSTTFETTGVVPELAGVLDDGTFVISGRSRDYPVPGEMRRISYTLGRYNTNADRVDDYGQFPGEVLIGVGGERNIPSIMQPFSPTTIFKVAGDRIFIGDLSRSEVLVLDSGQPVEQNVVSWQSRSVQVTPAIWSQWVERELREQPDPNYRRVQRDVYEDVEYRETLPEFQDLLVEDDGQIWIQHYPFPSAANTTWERLSDALRVTVPRSTRVLDIDTDTWLVTWKDELDVEYVGLASPEPP